MSEYFAQGPIAGPFFLTAVAAASNGSPLFFVLNSWQNPNAAQPLVYYFDPTYLDNSGAPAFYQPATFVAQPAGGQNFQFFDVTVQSADDPERRLRSNASAGGIGLFTTFAPLTAGHAQYPSILTATPVGAAPGPGLYAGVPYSLTDAATGAAVNFYSGAAPPPFGEAYGPPAAPLLADAVLLVPAAWFARGVGAACQQFADSLQAAFCTTAPFSGSAACPAILAPGWTSETLCRAGVPIEYCGPGAPCGAAGCLGACPRGDVCAPTPGASFACATTPAVAARRSILFGAGLAVFIVAVGALLAVGAIIVLSRKKRRAKPAAKRAPPAQSFDFGAPEPQSADEDGGVSSPPETEIGGAEMADSPSLTEPSIADSPSPSGSGAGLEEANAAPSSSGAAAPE